MPNGISGVIRKMTKTVVKSSIDIEIKSIKLTSVDLHITFCSTKQIFFFQGNASAFLAAFSFYFHFETKSKIN